MFFMIGTETSNGARSPFSKISLTKNKYTPNVSVILKNFDFLLIVKTIDEETIDTGSFYERIKNIKDVQLALEIHYLTPAEQKRIENDF